MWHMIPHTHRRMFHQKNILYKLSNLFIGFHDMCNLIKIQECFSLLDEATLIQLYDHVHEWNQKSRNQTTTALIPVLGQKPTEDGTDRIKLYFSKENICILDVLNTLSYLMSKTAGVNELHLKRIVDKPKWEVYSGWFNSQDAICVVMPRSDIYVIRYGLATKLFTHHTVKKHTQSNTFPWIIRALIDNNDTVFKHGMGCLQHMLIKCSNNMITSEQIRILRLLPKILMKFGLDKNKEMVWEKHFFQGYPCENDFMKGLITFCVPPRNVNIDCMYISGEGIRLLKYAFTEPDLLQFVVESSKHKCKDDDRYKFTLPHCPCLWEQFYRHLVSPRVSPEDALSLFMSVSNKRSLKRIARKRKITTESRTKVWDKRVEDKYCGMMGMADFNKSGDRNLEAGDDSYFEALPAEGKRQLMKLISFLEMRQDYMNICQSSTISAKHFCNNKHNESWGPYLGRTILSDTLFEPVAVFPRGVKSIRGGDSDFAKYSFPFIMMRAQYVEGLEKLLGENIQHNVFNKIN